jgi:hypothetical protein
VPYLCDVRKILNIILFFIVGGTHVSCQTMRHEERIEKNICEVQKTEKVRSYKRGATRGSLILTLNVDSLLVSERRARIRIFVNLNGADIGTPIESKHYLGGFSNFPSDGTHMAYIFNFSSFLDRFPEEESQKILKENIFLTFVAVPFEGKVMIKSFEVIVGKCTLDVSVD